MAPHDHSNHLAIDDEGRRRLAIVLKQLIPIQDAVETLVPVECHSPKSVQPLNRREANWGGNIKYKQVDMVMPRSLEDIQKAVRGAPGKVRVVGRGHSFSPCSEVEGGTLISLMQFSKVIDYQPPGPGRFGSVTFQGGTTFTDLGHFLQEQSPKAALRQTPSPLFITVAGACATGTHGSGPRNPSLAQFVKDVELVAADGSVHRYDWEKKADEMPGAVTNAGCLGVVSQMTMQVVPWMDVQIYRHVVSLDCLLDNWNGIYAVDDNGRLLCDSCSTWVDWQRGVAMVTARHFTPHYDPSMAAEAPHWGDHPFHESCKRWKLLAVRKADLASTAETVGLTLDANVVSAVIPGSMAAGAGITAGWVLKRMGLGPQAAGARGPGPGDAMVEVTDGSGAVDTFLELPGQDIAGPFMPGREPKIMFIFENLQAPESDLEANEAWLAPWYDNMPVWPLGFACAPGPECEYGNQAEYFFPAEHAVEAIRAAWGVMRHWSWCDQSACPVTADLRGEYGYDLENTGMLGIGELRCVKGDELWISPCSSRDTVSIHISFSGHPARLAEITRLLPDVEKALEPYGARCHWGKLHTNSFYAPRLKALYGDGLQKFRNLAQKLDPTGKFRNSWANELIFSGN